MRGSSLIVAAAGLLAACGAPPPGRQPANEIPPAFRGVYDSTVEACARPSENRLTVSAGELRFHESIGTVREVTVEGPRAIRVASDFQGEGESWQAAHRLRLADGGATLTVTGKGTSLARVRCEAA